MISLSHGHKIYRNRVTKSGAINGNMFQEHINMNSPYSGFLKRDEKCLMQGNCEIFLIHGHHEM